MASEIRALPDQHPAQIEGVHASLEALYNWNYETEIEELLTADLEPGEKLRVHAASRALTSALDRETSVSTTLSKSRSYSQTTSTDPPTVPKAALPFA